MLTIRKKWFFPYSAITFFHCLTYSKIDRPNIRYTGPMIADKKSALSIYLFLNCKTKLFYHKRNDDTTKRRHNLFKNFDFRFSSFCYIVTLLYRYFVIYADFRRTHRRGAQYPSYYISCARETFYGRYRLGGAVFWTRRHFYGAFAGGFVRIYSVLDDNDRNSRLYFGVFCRHIIPFH